MKKSIFVLLLFFFAINSNSQTASINKMYKWNLYRTVDGNYNVSRQYSLRESKVIFYSYKGKEHIRIIGYDGGDNVWYDGKVIDKKPKSVNENEECYVYLFQNESGVWKSFVQLFEIYDMSKSKFTPIRFLIHQTDLNGNFQTGKILEDISR